MNIEEALQEVELEHGKAIDKFPIFCSPHEGISIIREEYLELEQEVFKNPQVKDKSKMQKEATQLAAMAVRFLVDLC